MTGLTTIEIRKDYLHFSAAHFTIFSATERERLHGHNWQVAALITGPVGDDGLCFDYALYKDILRDMCERYDEYTLIPENSPHLTVTEQDEYYRVVHHDSTMLLLKSDTRLLPVRNITIEEMAGLLLSELLAVPDTVEKFNLDSVRVEVSSGAKQWASSEWQRKEA